jgi:ABC-2 type transport system permease protein
MRRALRQLAFEQRVYWRNRPTAFFTFVLPLLFLAVFGLVGRDAEVDGRPYTDYFIPGMLGLAVILTTFAGLAITLVIRRERGQLKRVRGTPLPPSSYMGALIGSNVLVLAIETVVVLAVGSLALGLDLPGRWPEIVGLVVLGAACFATLGIAVSPLVPNAEGSSAVVNAMYVPVLLLSGAFFPVDELPDFLEWLAEALPLTHLLDAMRAVLADGGLSGDDLAGLLVPIAWAVGAGLVAARTFRWTPQGG